MEKTYRSRISVMLTIIYWGILSFISVSIFIKTLRTSFSQPLPLVLFGMIFIFFAIVWLRTRYIFEGDWIIIKIGPFTTDKVYIPSVVAIRRSYSILSAPANSRKRLALRMKIGNKHPFVLLSPEKEVEFITELKKINPEIDVDLTIAQKKWKIWDWDF